MSFREQSFWAIYCTGGKGKGKGKRGFI